MVAVVMLGASGAVGGAALQALETMAGVTRVTLLNRHALSVQSPKVTQHLVDVGDPASYAALLPGHDAAICTLGVGEPSKTPREEFRRVDHDIPLAFGRASAAAGIGYFSLLSAVGSNARSRFYYARSKGELEDSLRTLGFARLALFHPSMILTPQNRYGTTQALMLAVWPWLDPLLAGPLRRLRGIKVADLGRAMAVDALQGGTGTAVLEWDAIQDLAQHPA
jgi:Predicted nucleoside-diphosphate-sugar epimerases